MNKAKTIVALVAAAIVLVIGIGVAQAADTPGYATVAWKMPATEDWPQSLATYVSTPTADVNALDEWLKTAPCGRYQVDVYKNGPGLHDLLAGKVLTGPEGDAAYVQEWKFVTVTDCAPPPTTPTTTAPPTTTTQPPTTTTTAPPTTTPPTTAPPAVVPAEPQATTPAFTG